MRNIIFMVMIGMITLNVDRVDPALTANSMIQGEQNSTVSQVSHSITTPENYFITEDDGAGGVTITGIISSHTEVIIPETIDGQRVTSIGSRAFFKDQDIEMVEIPDSVETIGWAAFQMCGNLESVKMGKSVKLIRFFAFYNCTSLKSIEISDSLESIDSYAFLNCSKLETLKMGKSLKIISSRAFAGCTSLTSVEIPDSIENIANFAFRGCTSLTSMVLPNTLKSVSANTFENSSVNKLIFICQDVEAMDISPDIQASDFYNQNISIYRIAKDIKSHYSVIKSYEDIGQSLSLEDIFMTGVIYTGATGTEKYEGSEIKLEDYFDMSVTSYALIGNRTSSHTRISDSQLYIGADEKSSDLCIQAKGNSTCTVPIHIQYPKSLSIKEESKNTYDENDTYNPAGLVLTMIYEDGYEKDIEYHDDNDDITFEYQTVDMNTSEQIIRYKGFEVKQPLTIYGHQTLSHSEAGIQMTGILTNNGSLKIEKINNATTLYTLNGKEIIVGYDVQVIGEYKDKLTIVFDIENKHNGKRLYIRHIKHDGSIEEFEEIVNEGKMTVIVNELSPFIIYTDKEKNESTTDINNGTSDKPNQNTPVIISDNNEIITNNEDKQIQGIFTPTGDYQEIFLWGIVVIISVMTTIISIKYKLKFKNNK